MIMLRTLVRRGVSLRTTAAARESPRCLATVDDAKTTERKTLDLSTAPTAAAANAVPEEERSGALALLRVGGDLGMLTGSAAFGALAASAGSDTAFGAAAALLVGTAAGFRLAAPGK